MFAGGPLAGFGANGLLAFGLGSALLAALGMLAASRLAVQVSWAVVISAGTLLAALGLGDEVALGARPLLSRTVHHRLLRRLPARGSRRALADGRDGGGRRSVPEREARSGGRQPRRRGGAAGRAPVPGVDRPARLRLSRVRAAHRGTSAVSHLPGQGGHAVRRARPRRPGVAGGARGGIFVAALLCCGFLALIALTRTGIRTFWSGARRQPLRVRAAEAVPVVALLGLCAALTVAAGPAMTLARVAARALHDRREYVDAVLGTDGAAVREDTVRPTTGSTGGAVMRRRLAFPVALDRAVRALAPAHAVAQPRGRSCSAWAWRCSGHPWRPGSTPAVASPRRPVVMAKLFVRVVADMLRSNAEVDLDGAHPPLARGFAPTSCTSRSSSRTRTGWRSWRRSSPSRPGPPGCELSVDKRTLLLHVFAVDDEARVIAAIKQRYERPLREIFE